jgi:hydrogenase maturation protein HypF
MNNSPLSGSMGRYLDAISSYLNICTKMTYGGEPAVKLEKYLEIGNQKYNLNYEIKDNVLQVTDIFNQIDEFVKPPFTEKDKADISFSMVSAIVRGLLKIATSYAQEQNIKNIGLSGGVSYNIPIVEMFEKEILKSGLNLIIHKHIPNGDGGISIGQNVIIGNKLK